MVQRIRGTQKGGWYCRPCANDKSKAYRLSAPDAVLDSKLWTLYRIRLADFRRMVEEQGGRCKACGRVPTGTSGFGGSPLVIDHDHRCCDGTRRTKRICGKCIRGLLCTPCNVALGMVDDDPQRLRQLIQYVESHDTSSPASRARSASALAIT
jgi:hypothetical protein